LEEYAGSLGEVEGEVEVNGIGRIVGSTGLALEDDAGVG
jgi:hypothetical protein